MWRDRKIADQGSPTELDAYVALFATAPRSLGSSLQVRVPSRLSARRARHGLIVTVAHARPHRRVTLTLSSGGHVAAREVRTAGRHGNLTMALRPKQGLFHSLRHGTRLRIVATAGHAPPARRFGCSSSDGVGRRAVWLGLPFPGPASTRAEVRRDNSGFVEGALSADTCFSGIARMRLAHG